MGARAVFPGTFDPLTVAHLAVADAAHAELSLDTVELVISEDPIGKSASAPLADRLAAIARHGVDRPWLVARSTRARLLADVAEGYDVLVIGADKWHQIVDESYYAGAAARDAALARLPHVAIAPRAGVALPEVDGVHVLHPPPEVGDVSSTAVRGGRTEWLA